ALGRVARTYLATAARALTLAPLCRRPRRRRPRLAGWRAWPDGGARHAFWPPPRSPSRSLRWFSLRLLSLRSSLYQFRRGRGALDLDARLIGVEQRVDEVGLNLNEAALLGDVVEQSLRAEFIGLPDDIKVGTRLPAHADAEYLRRARRPL